MGIQNGFQAMKKAKSKPRTRSAKRTEAFASFSDNIWKITALLKHGLSGISGKAQLLEGIARKFNSLEGIPGPAPKSYPERIEVSLVPDTDEIELELDVRTAWKLKRFMEQARQRHTELRFHLYAILTVAIWGAFETYVVMLCEELYRKRPDILKSEETITFREVLEHRDAVLDFLIERQTDKIGHFTLAETLKYLKARFNFEFGHSMQQDFAEFYLIRNIVAHNSGVVQSVVLSRLPLLLKVKDGKLIVTKAFLTKMLLNIQKAVVSVETHIDRKFD